MTIVNTQTFAEDIKKLENMAQIVVDVETNGLDVSKNQICGIGVGEAIKNGWSQYYPIRHHQGENLYPEQLKTLIEKLNDIPEHIGYNVKFDLSFLEKDGLTIPDKTLTDVIVMVRLIEHSDVKMLKLEQTLKRRYGEEFAQYDIDTKKYLRSNGWIDDFSLAPSDVLGEYCKRDVELTALLYQDCLNIIKRTEQEKVFALEQQLTYVLYKMERHGITIDKEYALEAQEKLTKRIDEVEQKILALSGRIKWDSSIKSANKHDEKEFNISSSLQVGKVFEGLGIKSSVKTPKGEPSWDSTALVNINHPIAGLIRQYRTLVKINSTYLKPYTDIDMMHSTFCNWGTATGRLSSRKPNLQNIPRNHFKLADAQLTDEQISEVRSRVSAMMNSQGVSVEGELSDEVIKTWAFIGDESFDDTDETQIALRRLFVARPDYELVSFDYSQMEVRVFMSYFRNEDIDKLLFKEDVDFHGEAAKLAFNVTEEDEQYKFYRQMAKGITFGTIYGIGNKGLANQLGTSIEEAAEYKQKYFSGLKGSRGFFDSVVAKVADVGVIKNRYGRKYQIIKTMGYKGVNYLVQGTSADLLSERMIEVDKFLDTTKSHILLQVHDEIICEIHKSEIETIPNQIRDLLEQNTLDIPLKVDMEVCTPSWATKRYYEEPQEVEIIDNDDSIIYRGNLKAEFNDDKKLDFEIKPFDKDLPKGQIAERKIADILMEAIMGTYEVKAEYGKAQESGNAYIEYSSRQKASGIETTESEKWVDSFFTQDDEFAFAYIFRVDWLKELLEELVEKGEIRSGVPGGDDYTSLGYLPPIEKLLNEYTKKYMGK